MRKERTEAYVKLHDMLSDMIEGGRLKEVDIPDDYQALVEHLAGPCQEKPEDNQPKWKVFAEQHGGVWGEHPKYLKEDWQEEAANNDTVLGYWDWVRHQIEMEEL